MTLVDSGPLVALFDRKDPYHASAIDVANQLPDEPLISTWPVFTESMHMLGRTRGIVAQRPLWTIMLQGKLELRDIDRAGAERMEQLMSKYADLPMDLADASLVVLAETMGFKRIFSFDGDFRIYRLADGSVLEVVP